MRAPPRGAPGCPTRPAQQGAEVEGVTEPRAGLKEVYTVNDLLLGGGLDQLLLVPPDLQETVAGTPVRQALHQVTVDTGGQVVLHPLLLLVVTPDTEFGEIYPGCLVLLDIVNILQVRFIVSPEIIIVIFVVR